MYLVISKAFLKKYCAQGILRKQYSYAKAMGFNGVFNLMITIIKKKTGKQTIFKNYQACYKHIRFAESNKHANFLIPPLDTWVFTRHSMRRIMAFHQYACQQLKMNQQYPDQKLLKLDTLEICFDHSQKPILIPMTPDLDLQVLFQDWCHFYFQSRGYEFLEVVDGMKGGKDVTL